MQLITSSRHLPCKPAPRSVFLRVVYDEFVDKTCDRMKAILSLTLRSRLVRDELKEFTFCECCSLRSVLKYVLSTLESKVRNIILILTGVSSYYISWLEVATQ